MTSRLTQSTALNPYGHSSDFCDYPFAGVYVIQYPPEVTKIGVAGKVSERLRAAATYVPTINVQAVIVPVYDGFGNIGLCRYLERQAHAFFSNLRQYSNREFFTLPRAGADASGVEEVDNEFKTFTDHIDAWVAHMTEIGHPIRVASHTERPDQQYIPVGLDDAEWGDCAEIVEKDRCTPLDHQVSVIEMVCMGLGIIDPSSETIELPSFEEAVDDLPTFDLSESLPEDLPEDLPTPSQSWKGQLIMPCGTGKSYIFSFVIARLLEYQPDARVLILVPQLSIKSSVIDALQRCGLTIASIEQAVKSGGIQVVTYQYATGPMSPYRGQSFDLVVYDEAHHLMGVKKCERSWTQSMTFKSTRRLYVTATPSVVINVGGVSSSKEDERVDDEAEEDVEGETVEESKDEEAESDGESESASKSQADASEKQLEMDEQRFGPVLYRQLMADAIKAGRIVSMTVCLQQWDEPTTLCAHMVNDYGMLKQVWFFNWCADAKREFEALTGLVIGGKKLKVFYLDASTEDEERSRMMREFQADDDPAVIFTAKVIGEGVDIPCIDAVVFRQSMTSSIGVMQRIGRAMRKHRRHDGSWKELAFVVLDYRMTELFRAVRSTLQAAGVPVREPGLYTRARGVELTDAGIRRFVQVGDFDGLWMDWYERCMTFKRVYGRLPKRVKKGKTGTTQDENSQAIWIDNRFREWRRGLLSLLKQLKIQALDEGWQTKIVIKPKKDPVQQLETFVRNHGRLPSQAGSTEEIKLSGVINGRFIKNRDKIEACMEGYDTDPRRDAIKKDVVAQLRPMVSGDGELKSHRCPMMIGDKQCGAGFAKYFDLCNHLRKVHRLSESQLPASSKPFPCGQCGAGFASAKERERHYKNVHEDPSAIEAAVNRRIRKLLLNVEQLPLRIRELIVIAPTLIDRVLEPPKKDAGKALVPLQVAAAANVVKWLESGRLPKRMGDTGKWLIDRLASFKKLSPDRQTPKNKTFALGLQIIKGLAPNSELQEEFIRRTGIPREVWLSA